MFLKSKMGFSPQRDFSPLFPLAASKYFCLYRTQLHGCHPSFHTTISTTWPQSPLSRSLRTCFPVLYFLASSTLPPSLHSVVLFVRFPGSTNKSSGSLTVKQLWDPFGLNFADHSDGLVCFQLWESRRNRILREGRDGSSWIKQESGETFLFY